MSFSDAVAADRRLMILKLLGQTAGYGANTVLIASFLASMGHSVSADLLTGEVAWLAEQGFVSQNGEAVLLTMRGADIANGVSRHPGVRRPRPGE